MEGKKFHLEQVLKYRQEVERMCKADFVSAKHNLEDAHERLLQVETQVTNISEEFCHRQGDLHCIEELLHYANFFARRREDIKLQREQVDVLGEVMNERRDILLDATKEKKVLESLKDKKAEEFKLAMKLKEQNFMDEIATQKTEKVI